MDALLEQIIHELEWFDYGQGPARQTSILTELERLTQRAFGSKTNSGETETSLPETRSRAQYVFVLLEKVVNSEEETKFFEAVAFPGLL